MLHRDTSSALANGCLWHIQNCGPWHLWKTPRTISRQSMQKLWYARRAAITKKGGIGEDSSIRSTELMHRLISSVSYRITTKEALSDLPKFKHEVRRFKMSAASRKVYNEMSSKLYAEFDENEITAANAMVKGLRLMQITSGIVKDSEGIYHRIEQKRRLCLLISWKILTSASRLLYSATSPLI